MWKEEKNINWKGAISTWITEWVVVPLTDLGTSEKGHLGREEVGLGGWNSILRCLRDPRVKVGLAVDSIDLELIRVFQAGNECKYRLSVCAWVIRCGKCEWVAGEADCFEKRKPRTEPWVISGKLVSRIEKSALPSHFINEEKQRLSILPKKDHTSH